MMRLVYGLLFAPAVVTALDANTPDPNAVNVTCTTTKGSINVEVNPSWAPLGAQRFLDLVDSGFYNKIALYRVVPGFLVQFGVPFTTGGKTWPAIKDDPSVGVQYPLFKRGMLAFAGSGPNSRTSEVFIGYQDTQGLGRSAWDVPFGIVTSGMNVVDNFYSGYGDLSVFGGHAPDPIRMRNQGGAFLTTEFPNIDYITSCARAGGAKGKAAAPAAPKVLPPCTADFCGYGSAYNGTTVCLCHPVCLTNTQPLPCCPSFQQACPKLYAQGTAPAPTPAAGKAAGKGKAGKGKNAKGKVVKKVLAPTSQGR